MADYSMVILVGRLTRDPELKYGATGGLPYTRLSVAVKQQAAQQDGTVKKTESVFDVTVWRHQAELCCQFLKKGSTVMVIGTLEQRRDTDARLDVVADRVQFLDRALSVQDAPAEAPNR